MEKKRKKDCFKVIIFLSILILIFYPNYRKIKKLEKEKKNISKRIEEIRKNNEILKEKIHKLETDVNYIEKRAREKLGLLGKGEILYEFVPQNDSDNK